MTDAATDMTVEASMQPVRLGPPLFVIYPFEWRLRRGSSPSSV